jgi:hypothetical protein
MYVQQSLVRDGSLMLSIDESLREAASEWMPSLTEMRAGEHPPGPSLRVDRGTLHDWHTAGAPSLQLGRVRAWVDAANDVAWLSNDSESIRARADLASRVATVAVPDDVTPLAADFTSVLTITAAMLLVRDGRTAIHAGAVVRPDTGGAWLLVGDSHSGKSTTTANLVRAGWSYLSDDYVVLSRADNDDIEVEGWPDDFHLDEGWHRGESTGVRSTVREDELPEGRRAQFAQLEGVLFPRVSRDEATVVTEISPVVALERLIRQSPWLIADAKAAGRVFELLKDAASNANGELRLGLDTFAQPEALDRVVRSFADSIR